MKKYILSLGIVALIAVLTINIKQRKNIEQLCLNNVEALATNEVEVAFCALVNHNICVFFSDDNSFIFGVRTY